MIKNILVPLAGCASDANALEAAYHIGARFSANVLCLRVHPNPMQIVAQAAFGQFGTGLGSVELIHAIEKQCETRSQNARAAFEQFSQRVSSPDSNLGNVTIAATWQEKEGDPLADTIMAARYSDMVVMGRAPKDSEFNTDRIANILVRSGRPVLLVPDKPVASIGSHIAIAWKETAEAARAVTAAMPLILQAERVAVLSADEREASATRQALGPAARLAEQVAHHGLKPNAQDIAFSHHAASQSLVQGAREWGADLMIAGAYSHSRFRELVFGGFTRQVLQACELPVLLLH
jgi:nucleotide-binding universal stress UspA family protein